MKNKKYSIVIFDMDGTVLNSDPMILEAMNILYDKYRDGVRTPKEKVVYFSGPPIRETLKTEFPAPYSHHPEVSLQIHRRLYDIPGFS